MRIIESVSNPAYSTLLVGDYQLQTIQHIPQNMNNPYPINAYSQTPPPAIPANPTAGFYPSFSSLSTYYTTSYSSPSPYPALSYNNSYNSVDSSLIESMDDVEAIAITADATSVHVEEFDSHCDVILSGR